MPVAPIKTIKPRAKNKQTNKNNNKSNKNKLHAVYGQSILGTT